MLIKIALFLLMSVLVACSTSSVDVYEIYPIGFISRQEGSTRIEIDPHYEDALLGLNEFSHVLVCYWFHKNDTPGKRKVLTVYPRGNPQNPLHGIFATRSPVRPNLIGISICEVLSIKDNIIHIETIDAFDGSPVIDLKPYIPTIDSIIDARVPAWILN